MNHCNGCTACCSVLEIKELSKPANTTCSSCTGKGCGVYDTRPETCKNFKCAYLNSDWPENLRPDKCGVIIAPFKTDNAGEVYYGIRIKDEVSKEIMDKIQYLEDMNDLTIHGRDGRPKK